MFNIGEFLKRSQNVQTKELVFKETVCKTINLAIGTNIAVEDVSIKDGVVRIPKLNSSSYSEIFLRKQKIIDQINRDQSSFVVRNISK